MPQTLLRLGLFYFTNILKQNFMATEQYDDLEWEVDDMPIGSSTPDDFFELSYRATSECPHCGAPLDGTAQYWSRSEDMFNAWLERIDYEYCECQLENEFETFK